MNNYHIYEEIGRGQHSVVYKGREKQSINYVAIKSVTKEHKPYLLPQVAVLYNLSHPNVLRFVNWYETSKFIWLIVEYCCGADLQSVLKQDTVLPEVSALVFAIDIASGLQYVHSRGFLFGALRPSALLLNESGVLKLSNFAHAKAIPQLDAANSKQRQFIDDAGAHSAPAFAHRAACCELPPYLAPELVASQQSSGEAEGTESMASDIYSFGCLLYELVSGVSPAAPVQHLEQCSADLNELLQRLLDPNPYTRAEWSEILQHAWFRQAANIKQLKLPQQPLFEALAAQYKAHVEQPSPTRHTATTNGHHANGEQQRAWTDDREITVATAALALAAVTPLTATVRSASTLSSDSVLPLHPTPARPVNGHNGVDKSPLTAFNRSDDPMLSMQSDFGRNLHNSSQLNGSGLSNDSFGADILADSEVHVSSNGMTHSEAANNASTGAASHTNDLVEAADVQQFTMGGDANAKDTPDSQRATSLSTDGLSTAEKLLQRRNKFKQKFATLKDKYSSSTHSVSVNRTTSLTHPTSLSSSPSAAQLTTPRKTQPRSRTLDKLSIRPATERTFSELDSPVQQENQHDNWSTDSADVVSTTLPTLRYPLVAPATAAARPRLPLRRTATATSIGPTRSNSARVHRRSGGSKQQAPVNINSRSSDFVPSPTALAVAAGSPWQEKQLQQMLFTALDSSIKPLIGNAKIEKLSWSSKWSSKLPFEPLSPLDILSLGDSQQLEEFLTALYREVGGDPAVSNGQKLNALTYLQTIITDSNIANLVMNSSLCTLLIRLAQQASATPINLAASILHTLGLLLRHATIINPDVLLTPLAVNSVEREKSMLTVLTDATRDGLPVQTRRRAVCALGELVFYVASQTSSATSCHWKVSQAAYKQLLRMLRPDEDEVVRHYACMAIHNVLCHLTEQGTSSQQQHPAVAWFVNSEALLSLLALFQSSKNMHLRSITMAALSAIARVEPTLLGKLVDKLQWPALCSALEDESPRVQQAALNMVNMALHQRLARVHSLCCKDSQLLDSLLRLIVMSDSRHRSTASDMSSPLLTRRQHTARTQTQNKQLLEVRQALRGKAFLTLALLLDGALTATSSASHSTTVNLSSTLSRPSSSASSASLVAISPTAAIRLVVNAFEQGLATHIDRSESDGRHHQHLQHCLQYLRSTLLSANEWMLSELSSVVKQVATRRNSSAEQLRSLTEMLQCYPLTEKLLQTSYCRSHVFTPTTLTAVRHHIDALLSASSNATTTVTIGSPAGSSSNNTPASSLMHGQYQQQLVLLLEAMKHQTALLTDLPTSVVLSFLQSVRQLIHSSKQPELLFTAATAFTDILTVLMTQSQLYDATVVLPEVDSPTSTTAFDSDSDGSTSSGSLNQLLCMWFQTTFRLTLQLQQPIPQHTLRAAAVFTRIQPQLAHSFSANQLLPLLLQQYTVESVNCSVHLCQLLVNVVRQRSGEAVSQPSPLLTQCATFFQHVIQHRLSAYYEVQAELLAVLLVSSWSASMSLPSSVWSLTPALATLLVDQLAHLSNDAAASDMMDESMDVSGGDEAVAPLRRAVALLPCLLHLQLVGSSQQSSAVSTPHVYVAALHHTTSNLLAQQGGASDTATHELHLLTAGVAGLVWLTMLQTVAQHSMDASASSALRRSLQQMVDVTADDTTSMATLLSLSEGSAVGSAACSSHREQLLQMSLHQLIAQVQTHLSST